MHHNLSPVFLSILLLAAGHAAAAGDIQSITNTELASQSRTAADYVTAKPVALRVSSLPATALDYNSAIELGQTQAPQVSPGQRGTENAMHLAREFAVPTDALSEQTPIGNAVGTSTLQFNSSRIGPKTLDTTYPVSTVGKLYFTIGTSTYMCSGSMIKPGVVLTAGHCVHSGNGAASGWYSNFEFIPGYRKKGSSISAPFGRWTSWKGATISSTWYSGGGSVPNAADFATIVFNTNSAGKRIGDYTGWLGWGTGVTIGRQATILGYPANLDAGGQLHRVDSLITNYGSASNGTWGSDMEGGSSGGPVVVNWRVDYTNSSTKPSENWSNIATSVVSWGYTSSSPKAQGGAAFGTAFTSLMNYTCTTYAWAC